MKPEKLEQSKQSQTAKYLVDANIFLEVELDQEKADVCEMILRKFHLGELEGVLVDFAIDTVVIIMENYGKKWSEIRTFLSSLLGYKGLRVHFSSLLDRIMATNHMKNYDLDFDDALALQAMKENKIENIISYDKDFDKIPFVKRIQPESLL
ncbi:hypothetical protein DRO59_05705 [Candidatus Bathyarchaeota archaeon]|nr:MAG: hypothetical protein DRO59_05705 [Candidatus Bathyarchaeota archaeon]